MVRTSSKLSNRIQTHSLYNTNPSHDRFCSYRCILSSCHMKSPGFRWRCPAPCKILEDIFRSTEDFNSPGTLKGKLYSLSNKHPCWSRKNLRCISSKLTSCNPCSFKWFHCNQSIWSLSKTCPSYSPWIFRLSTLMWSHYRHIDPWTVIRCIPKNIESKSHWYSCWHSFRLKSRKSHWGGMSQWCILSNWSQMSNPSSFQSTFSTLLSMSSRKTQGSICCMPTSLSS